ncbi:MAG: FkbM family methyltransferase [Rhodosalinus sp.]
MQEQAIATECMGLKVPASPFLTETRIRRIAAARYEGEEIRAALALIERGDRVLELGAGLGIVGALTALRAQPEAVLSYEANPALVPHIQALYRANGLTDRIAVRNAVLWAGPGRPETVTFNVHNSYLGSSLAGGARTQPVEVATEDFAAVRAAFRPTVLVADIEGAELELLEHADLTGLRTVVIEFHPKIYGPEGMRRAKDILRAQGFARRHDVSTRMVWGAERDAARATAEPVGDPPHPDGGWSTALRTVEGARVYPPTGQGLVTPAGVRDAEGRLVPEAALWRNRRLLTAPPPVAPPAARLSGRWLWGGVFMRTFSHFVAESPARLWALDAETGPLDGLLFIDRRGRDAPMSAFHRDFFALMGIDLPVRLQADPAQVQELIVPGQGFGLGAITAGTAAFRATMQARFARDVAPEGPERLYISRSALGPGRGGLIGEDRLEAELAAQGYEIFHPERHDLATQAARYKAARQVVAAEGSALHLFAFLARPEQQVAVIVRRRSGATDQIAAHIAAFAGRPPLLIETLSRVWRDRQVNRKRLDLGELDLPRAGAALAEAGFIGNGDWPALCPEDIPDAVHDTHMPR